MTILVVPSLNCNLHCGYCFAHGYDWNTATTYNLEAMLESMETLHNETKGDSFCLHGGECTLINRRDLETILKKMYDLQGCSSLQTNCYKIDNDLVRLFKNYKTSIGVSIDGDGSLNALRGFPEDEEKNKQYTDQVLNNIFTLYKEGISVGLIVVLTKVNADSDAKLERLVQFILMLKGHGIKGGRFNIMWSNYSDNKKYELTSEEASHAWVYLYEHLKKYSDLQWQPFREFTDNLLGFGHSSCSYGKCDYFCTSTKVILPDGSYGNCDRTHQEGSTYTRAQMSYERYEVLKQTDCCKCKFWDVCYGGCPSEGQDGDWRNKSRWCKPIYDMYSAIESDLEAMLPNVKLMVDYQGNEDYFDAIRKGAMNEPFEKMTATTANNPSSWRQVSLKKKPADQNKPTNNQPKGMIHGDFTNKGGDQKC